MRPQESFAFSTHLLRLIFPFSLMIFILIWSLFRLRGICLCLGLFTTFFLRWLFRYGVWAFMRLFCPKWFCKWLRTIFWGMWTHCLKSCFTFNIVFASYISTFNVGEIIFCHVPSQSMRCDLSFSCLYFSYSKKGYFHGAF